MGKLRLCCLVGGLISMSACGESTAECPKFVDYERSAVNVTGIRAQIHRVRGSAGEVEIQPVSREASPEIQRLDMLQYNICQQMQALPEGWQRDSIRMEYLGELRNMLAAPASSSTSSPTDGNAHVSPLASPGAPAAQAGGLRLGGEWHLRVAASATLTVSRHRRESNATTELTVRLTEQGGSVVQGSILWGAANACTSASISGTRSGDEFSLVISYFGSCCNGGRVRFAGKLTAEGVLTGTFEPLDAPPRAHCWLWWAEVSGTRAS